MKMMKKFSLLVALALIVTIGGVYATWIYGDASKAKNLETNLRQHRAIRGDRLDHATACIFSVTLHQKSLPKVYFACAFLVCLTKDLTAHLRNQNCAVLP